MARGFHQPFLRRRPMGLSRPSVVMSRLRVKVPKRNIVPLSVDEVARFCPVFAPHATSPSWLDAAAWASVRRSLGFEF